jgi:hypothetical protein
MRWCFLFLLIQQLICVNGTLTATKTTSTTPSSSPVTTASTSDRIAAVTLTLDQAQAPLSAFITIAPLPANPLERRQRCWDDRGFSVDCATWTGYYYTWGPPGNPYLGGPGEGGGSGSGGGNGNGGGTVVYQGVATTIESANWYLMLGLAILGVVLFL